MLLLLVMALVALNFSSVQNFIAQKATKILSEKLNTKVSIGSARVDFLNRISLENVYIEDLEQDTLLYAGRLQTQFTNWIIFKDKGTINSILLEDALIRIKRENSKSPWNFQFIIDAFASDKKKEKNNQELPDIELEKLNFNRVRIQDFEDNRGNKWAMQIGTMQLRGEDFDFKNRKIYLKDLLLEDFDFWVTHAPVRKNPPPIIIPDLSTKTPFNPQGYDIRLGEVAIKNGTFKLNTMQEPILPNQFDGRNIEVEKIQLKATQLQINHDTLTGNLTQLEAEERSGFVIQNLTGKVKVNPNIAAVSDLELTTNRSVLRGYYAMVYEQFPDFHDYINRVTMVANLRNSKVAMDDIAYFAPALHRWDGKTYWGGFEGRGTVPNLDIKNIDLKDDHLAFSGDYQMIGLPEIQTTTLDYKNGKIETTYDELKRLFPEIVKLDIKELDAVDVVNFEGGVTGKYNDLNIEGKLQTNLGTIQTQGLNLNYSGPQFLYKGRLIAQDFDWNPVFPQANLGSSAFDLNIQGDGFNYKKNSIQANGQIQSFTYQDYNYKNIDLNFDLKAGNIVATVLSKDPNANVDLDIDIKGLDQSPHYNVKGDIAWIDLERLHFLDRPLQGKAVVDISMTGKDLKNLSGKAALQNMMLIKSSDTLDYDNFAFEIQKDPEESIVSILTNNLKVNVAGAFYLDELVPSIQKYLSYYLSEIIPEPKTYVPEQDFYFSIQAENPEQIIHIFLPALKISSGLQINGSLKGSAQKLTLNGNIPFIQYNNLLAKNISINSSGDLAGLNLTLHANQFSSNEKEMIQNFDLIASAQQNKIQFDINTNSDNTFGTANIRGAAYAAADSFYLSLEPSELFFNNQKWDIGGDNLTVFAPKYLHIHNLIIQSEKQMIAINQAGKHEEEIEENLKIDLNSVNLKPILAMVGMEDLEVNGNINGSILAKDLPETVNADFDLFTSDLSTNGKKLGELKLVGNYNNKEQKLFLKSPSGMYDDRGNITLNGTLRIDTANTNAVDFRAVANNASLAWAEPFAAELTKNLSGGVSGFIDIKGIFPTPSINGSVTINEGHFTPLITNVDYTLPNTQISISSSLFTIKPCEVKDMEGNTGTISGTIAHEYFSNLNFDLRMVSDKIKVLDKDENAEDIKNFYGKVFAGVNLTLRGLLTNLNMNITARTAKNSKLYLLLASDTDLEKYEFITFKKPENEVPTSKPKDEKKTRLTINLDAIANQDLETEIILDPIAGDKIVTFGSGNVNMMIPHEGNIRLNGSYFIESGFYDFTFNSLQLLRYKNRFNLLPGSVINWDGSISDATVDVKANTIKSARLYDLIADDVKKGIVSVDNSSAERSDAMTPQNIVIDMFMTGKLLNPEIKFQLDLEESRSVGTYAYQKLQRINQDEKDLVNQVFSLLILNQFLPSDGLNSSLAMNTGVSNVAEMFSSFASSQVTNFTNRVLGIEDLSVNLKYKNYNLTDDVNAGGLNYLNRNEAGVSVRKNFFNDRLVLDGGFVYDWGTGSALSGNSYTTNLAGDFRLSYLLTESGNLRLNAFSTSSFDAVALQNIRRHGLGFSYRKSFNNLYDLFGIKRKALFPALPYHLNTEPDPLKDPILPPNNSDSLPSQSISYQK